MNSSIFKVKPNTKKTKVRYHLGALFAVIAWGLSFVSTKILMENGLSALEAYVYRFLIAYIILLCLFHKRLWCDSRHDEFVFMMCGILSGSVYFMLENTAMSYTLVANVSLLTSTSPLITTLLVGYIYKAEKITGGTIAGSLVALVGVAFVIFNASFNLQVNPIGDFLALLASFCWAIYSILLKRLASHYDIWFVTRKVFFYGILTSVPFFAFYPQFCGLEVLARPMVWGNIAFLALYPSLIAFVLWGVVNKALGSVTAGNYMYVQPIVTLVGAAILLNEGITVIGCLGCFLILFGLWLGDKLTKKNASR